MNINLVDLFGKHSNGHPAEIEASYREIISIHDLSESLSEVLLI